MKALQSSWSIKTTVYQFISARAIRLWPLASGAAIACCELLFRAISLKCVFVKLKHTQGRVYHQSMIDTLFVLSEIFPLQTAFIMHAQSTAATASKHFQRLIVAVNG